MLRAYLPAYLASYLNTSKMTFFVWTLKLHVVYGCSYIYYMYVYITHLYVHVTFWGLIHKTKCVVLSSDIRGSEK